MRAFLASALCLALLAGCTSTPAAEPTGDAGAQEATGSAQALDPAEPIELTGTIDSLVGGCLAPGGLPARVVPMLTTSAADVPPEAWDRPFDGPHTGDVTVNAGGMCVVWVLADGEEVPGGERVPMDAVKAVVLGDGQLDGSWRITVE